MNGIQFAQPSEGPNFHGTIFKVKGNPQHGEAAGAHQSDWSDRPSRQREGPTKV